MMLRIQYAISREIRWAVRDNRTKSFQELQKEEIKMFGSTAEHLLWEGKPVTYGFPWEEYMESWKMEEEHLYG